MHTLALRATFRRALLAASASVLAAGGCSPYGLEGNGPSIAPVPPGIATTTDPHGNLSREVRNQACLRADRPHESVRSCHLATLLSPPAPDEPRIVCDLFYSTGGSASFIGNLPAGRAPHGLEQATTATRDVVAAYFAQLAHLEAASVIAFQRLAEDLADHGAPLSLRRRARLAACDEARHARVARRLSRDAGVEPPPVRVLPRADRTLEDVVRENVVEGCVRETYAALVAECQSRTASHLPLRRAMKQIARDESRHAALAWSIHQWAMPRLDASARARVARARASAERDLAGSVANVSPELATVLGVPRGTFAVALARELAESFGRSSLSPSSGRARRRSSCSSRPRAGAQGERRDARRRR